MPITSPCFTSNKTSFSAHKSSSGEATGERRRKIDRVDRRPGTVRRLPSSVLPPSSVARLQFKLCRDHVPEGVVALLFRTDVAQLAYVVYANRDV